MLEYFFGSGFLLSLLIPRKYTFFSKVGSIQQKTSKANLRPSPRTLTIRTASCSGTAAMVVSGLRGNLRV